VANDLEEKGAQTRLFYKIITVFYDLFKYMIAIKR